MWVDNVSAAWPSAGRLEIRAGTADGRPPARFTVWRPAQAAGSRRASHCRAAAEVAGNSRGSSPNTRAAFRSVHQASWDSSGASSGPLVREQPGIRGIAPRRRALLPVRRLVMVGGDGQVDAVVTDGVLLTARWYRPGHPAGLPLARG